MPVWVGLGHAAERVTREAPHLLDVGLVGLAPAIIIFAQLRTCFLEEMLIMK